MREKVVRSIHRFAAARVTKLWALLVAIGAVFLLMVAGLVSVPLTFGETVTVMGMWVALGIVIGQHKPASMSVKEYLERRIVGIFCCFALFAVLGFVYMGKIAEADEKLAGIGTVGLLVLAAISLSIGFFAGQDRE